MDRSVKEEALPVRLAVDIGSTVVKVARVQDDGHLSEQRHYARDFESGIARQVEGLIDAVGSFADDSILVCSSANGGLRVGIVALSEHFSGATARNQVLLAGGNPVFLHTLGTAPTAAPAVDVLLLAGAIDCEDAGPFAERLQAFDASAYRFGSLVYAGNRYLADAFVERHPSAVVIDNPLAQTLTTREPSIFEALRRAYLDDLVHKEGVSQLRPGLARNIRPTPEVVSRGFLRALHQRSPVRIAGACILMDIGGATTDLHYTVEIVRDDSPEKPFEGSSIARYVFVDLGVVASRDSTTMQLRTHPRLYEFLAAVLNKQELADAYRLLREGEYEPRAELLSYGCLFLALDRFANGRGPGLPSANLNKVAQLILSGGAAQALDESVVARIAALHVTGSRPEILIDREYRFWVDGITWTEQAPLVGRPETANTR
jgi:hypothetical protein